MDYDELKYKVKKMGLRVTKDVKGKRTKLSRKQLQTKIGNPTLENQAKNARKFIRVCKMVLRSAQPPTPRAPRAPRAAPKAVRKATPQASPKRAVPPPPPPPPPPPRALNARTQLMSNLKANLKRRGLSQNA